MQMSRVEMGLWAKRRRVDRQDARGSEKVSWAIFFGNFVFLKFLFLKSYL